MLHSNAFRRCDYRITGCMHILMCNLIRTKKPFHNVRDLDLKAAGLIELALAALTEIITATANSTGTRLTATFAAI